MAAIFNTTLTSGPVSANNRGVLHTGTAGAVLLVWTWGNESTSMSAVNAGAAQLTRLGAVSAGTSRMELWGLTSVTAGVLTISAIVVGNNPQTYALLAQTFTGVRNPNPFGTVVGGTAAGATVADLSVSATTSSLVAFAFGISANTTITLQNGVLDGTATASTLGRVAIGHIAGASPTVSVSCSAGAAAQWGFMGVPLFDAPSISNAREDFNSSLDTAKWFTWEPAATPNSSSVTFVTGALNLTPAQTNTWSAILYMGTTNGYYKFDAIGAYAKCTSRLKTTNTAAGGYTIFAVYENDNTNTWTGFWIGTDNVLKASVFNAGVTQTATTITTTWDSDNTPWLKLTYSAGTNTAKWWTAPDNNGNPGTWTQRTAMATTAWYIPNLSKVQFAAGNDNWVATGSLTSPAKFDNFNDTRINVSAGITDAPDVFSASGTTTTVSGTNGRLSATDAQDTFAASARLLIASRLSATDAQDIFVASSQVLIASRLSATDAADVFASSAQVRITASMSRTDTPDTFFASGQVRITARLSATDALDTFSSSAQVRITASMARTDTPDTFSASSQVRITGRLSATDAQDIFAANVQTAGGPAPRSAVVAFTDPADTFSAPAYVVIAGSIAATDAPDFFSAQAATTSSPPVVVQTQDLGAGGGHARASDDYWQAREAYLLSLQPEIATEPEPEIFPEVDDTAEPASSPPILLDLRYERIAAIARVEQAPTIPKLHAAGERLRLINARILDAKRAELQRALAERDAIRSAIQARRDRRNREMARLRKQLALLDMARSLLHLQNHL